MDNNPILYTIGHSNQTYEAFLLMLQSQNINAVVDVRSVPASKYSPQFNKEPLHKSLQRAKIHYLHFGEEFGARRLDAINKDNFVDFEIAEQTPAFQNGVKRIIEGLNNGYRIAFMCSEANPLECHRFALVSRYFDKNGIDVLHIVHDKDGKVTIIPHKTLQEMMITEYVRKKKVPPIQPPDMFGENECTEEQQIKLAYRLKNKEIAYYQQIKEDLYL